MKPIRVFYSELSRRFYATRSYRDEKNGLVTVTGDKSDVTDDIARLIERHGITFKERPRLLPCDTENPYIQAKIGRGTEGG